MLNIKHGLKKIGTSVFIFALSYSSLFSSLSYAQSYAIGTEGAVASISEEASQAGLDILKKGGNAIDAAIATAATLGVTDPFSCGIGGGGFMLIYSADENRVITINSREVAPNSFNSNVYVDKNNEALDWETTVASGLSIGIPGTVRGWEIALEKYGSMEMKDVLQYAIGVAENGFTIRSRFIDGLEYNEEKFAKFETTSKFYHSEIKLGDKFKNVQMANAYKELAKNGADSFYSGKIANSIISVVNNPPVARGVEVYKGNMSLEDLKDYQATILDPTVSTYRGYIIYGMPVPSSGGIAVSQTLNILENFNPKSHSKNEFEHLYLQSSRMAFADRNAYIGDIRYVDVPVAGMLDKGYAKSLSEKISLEKDAGVLPPSNPFLFQDDPSYPLNEEAIRLYESDHTTHLVASDKFGNIVSYTFTIEDWGGSGIIVPEYGFLLNNELTDFNFEPPHPNTPEAKKAPRSSMSPTIVFKDNKPILAIGSPGGSTIITTVSQMLVNYIDLGMDLQKALNAPRMTQRNTESTGIEDGFIGSDQEKFLSEYGYRFSNRNSIGIANGLEFHEDSTVSAVAESSRAGGGTALVVNPK